MSSKNMKRCLTSLIIRKTQIKTTRNIISHPNRMVTIKRTESNKCWKGYNQLELLCSIGENIKWCNYENSMAVPQEIKNKITI